MQQSAEPDDDYYGRKRQIEDYLGKLGTMEGTIIPEFEKTYKLYQEEKGQLKQSMLNSSNTVNQLYEVQEQLIAHKNGIVQLYTDINNSMSLLKDIKREIGDCNLPRLIAARNREYNQVVKRHDRLSAVEC